MKIKRNHNRHSWSIFLSYKTALKIVLVVAVLTVITCNGVVLIKENKKTDAPTSVKHNINP